MVLDLVDAQRPLVESSIGIIRRGYHHVFIP